MPRNQSCKKNGKQSKFQILTMHNIVSEYFLVYLSYAGDNPPNLKQVNNNMGRNPFYFGSSPCTTMSDSGSDFATGGAAPATPQGRPSRTRRINVPTLASRAALCCYLVVDSTLPCPAALQVKWAKTVDREPHYDGDMLAIVGIIFSVGFSAPTTMPSRMMTR